MKRSAYILPALLLALLCACGTEPIQQDQSIVLAAGQGLAAVVFDAADPLTQVTLESADTKLEIPSLPAGVNLFLFQVPAGRYCFTTFVFGRWHFFAKDKQQQMGCFEVQAGQLGYSGTLAPRVINGELVTHQDMDMPAFRVMMNERYPIIAKQFLPPEVKPYTASDLAPSPGTTEVPVSDTAPVPVSVTSRKAPPAGNDQISSWMEEIPGTRAEVIFFRDNTGWPMEVKNFELYDCVAVKQKCGVQKARILLPPHVIKQAMIVEPADIHDVYTFRYRFIYGFAQNSK